jgi:SAM-dependent methyltransferase
MRCRICDSDRDQMFEVREMMFGYRDLFRYFQCQDCKCLQICEVPSDMSKYYPPDYYSFTTDFSKIPAEAVKNQAQAALALYFSSAGITRDCKVLDVGCGAGMHIYALKEHGFENVLGVDAFIKETIRHGNGAKVIKGTIFDIDQQWDLIMFNHSFEHMENPVEILRQVSRLLSESGTCFIRIPTVSSYAWEHYGVNWVQLDAPRHFFLYSVESIKLLGQKSGLDLKQVLFDSTEFQFWGSELYLRDIPLRAGGQARPSSIFTQAEMQSFRRKAQELNQANKGDQAAFYLGHAHAESDQIS